MTEVYDPRCIANLMLDESERIGQPLTNLALQKLLYFAHAIYLIEHGQPLVSGYFEAWEYGPVHPSAYQAFKSAGAAPISFKAARLNVVKGTREPIAAPTDPNVIRHVGRVIQAYGRMTPGRLVDVSHAKGAPWHFVVDKGRTSLAFGMRIPDEVIRERFKHHKVSVGSQPSAGEPSEDTPFA
ncbi:type VI toxin-antitoxin system SocA family antitoxin [Bradyrhizobium australafricanum]|uniref:type VI toxin-antitoxin system SocA family antitoxin n=1 Tax=Bradyrhizobium australafricanum TaxID=2821406 RepID=UPI001CE2DD1A|nr:Panacea domain-containing protein [Bradyrhizobium australafricanum]MCA6103609.1 SocA family protein [Bradyrhizobium australafricanum]